MGCRPAKPDERPSAARPDGPREAIASRLAVIVSVASGPASPTDLEVSFRRLRRTGDYREALRPLLRARLFVAGALTPLYDRPVLYARRSDVTGAPCITASEQRNRVAGEPGVTALDVRGVDLVFQMDADQDLVIVWPGSVEYLEAQQVEWFRETVRRNPMLRNEAGF